MRINFATVDTSCTTQTESADVINPDSTDKLISEIATGETEAIFTFQGRIVYVMLFVDNLFERKCMIDFR